MSILDRLLGRNTIQTLDLKRNDVQEFDMSKAGMPKPPPLDIGLDSLLRFAKRSELVYACIEKKASAAVDAVLVVEAKKGKDWEPLENHPLISLLNKPNLWDDGESFIRSWITSENFADAFYCEIVRSGAGLPVALYPLNPVWIVPQWFMGQQGWYIGWYYYFQNGYPVRLEVDDLLIRRKHGLGSIYANISNVVAALNSIDADTSATEYIRAFWNNGGAPSGVLAIKGRTLSQPEVDHIQQQWMARYARNGTTRNGPAVLPEGTTYTAVSAKLNELNNESLNDETTTKICMSFGVPPIIIGALVGLKHVTQNATAKAAMGEFWAHTMSPELKSIRNFLTWNLLPMFEPIEKIKSGQIRVNWDLSQVDAMQDDVDAVHSRVGEGYQSGIYMLNEARSKVGLPPVGDELGGNEFFKAPTPVVGQPGTPQNGKPPKDTAKALYAKWQADDEEWDKKHILDADTLEKKTVNFNGLTLSREPTELESQIDLKAMVDDLATEAEHLKTILLNLRNGLIDEAVREFNALKDSELFTLTLTPAKKIYSQIAKILTTAFARGQAQVVTELQRQGAQIADAIAEVANLETSIGQLTDLTVSRAVNEVQTRAINQVATMGVLGLGANEIRAQLGTELRDQSDKWIDGYSGAAVNAATQDGRKEQMNANKDEIGRYEYSAILDQNTCGPCEDADGMTASDMESLPDTPNPDCEGGDRCRCFIVAVFEGESA